MSPWESCPHRLASTRLRATRSASSWGTPPATNRDSAKEISTSAGKVGTAACPRLKVAASFQLACGASFQLAEPAGWKPVATVPSHYVCRASMGREKSMTFQVRAERRPNTFGLDDRVWVLEDG